MATIESVAADPGSLITQLGAYDVTVVQTTFDALEIKLTATINELKGMRQVADEPVRG